MKAFHITTIAVLTAVLGFAASVVWAQEGHNDLRVADGVICACIGQSNVG